MAKLWHVRVQGGLGKELYGPDYADIWAINRLHYKAASPPMCDHVSAPGIVFSTTSSDVGIMCVMSTCCQGNYICARAEIETFRNHRR